MHCILILILVQFSLALSPDGLSLLAFKSAVTDDPSSALSSWNSNDTDPCRWQGVSCANVSGSSRVVGIAVSAKNMSGYIPSEFGTLVFLRRLNLHGNRLSGSIPAQLFNASSLHSLFLYDNNFTGPLPDSLCSLPRLQNVDLSKNSLTGNIPNSLRECRQLQRLLLAHNRIAGPLPSGIWPALLNLEQLDVSSNLLTGSIPADIGDLNSLSGTLNLSHNSLTGKIPSSLGNLPATVSLDLRYNNLSGQIPDTLDNQGPTAFLNNNPNLCGFPLQNPCGGDSTSSSSPPGGRTDASATITKSSSSHKSNRKLKPSTILLISLADAAGVALVGLILIYVYWKVTDKKRIQSYTNNNEKSKNKNNNNSNVCCILTKMSTVKKNGNADTDTDTDTEAEEGKLVAIEKGFRVELDELLRASAYVLGKGGLGIVYKVVLSNGVPVAVRRLGEGGGGMKYKEFAAELKEIAKVRHPNVVRLRAYYWAPDEKLIITDFVSNGNLATALKGRPGQSPLSWSTRLRILKGAAHGLAHLHECSPRKFVHGHIKPSNILLDSDFTPFISDFGLFRLLPTVGPTPDHSHHATSSSSLGLPTSRSGPINRPNHYQPPEARGLLARPNQKWDVYSFGLVLLELLTGRTAEMASNAAATSSSSSSMSPVVEPMSELARWVRRGFNGSSPLSEIVDPALHREVHLKKEMLSVFHVALACTEADPEMRPRMKAVADNLDRVGN